MIYKIVKVKMILINFYRFLQMIKNVKEGESCLIQQI